MRADNVVAAVAFKGYAIAQASKGGSAMKSKELYQCLLGLSSPWTVRQVELDVGKRQVDVDVERPKGCWFGCPECGQVMISG